MDLTEKVTSEQDLKDIRNELPSGNSKCKGPEVACAHHVPQNRDLARQSKVGRGVEAEA